MNEFLKESQEKSCKQLKETNKSVQDLKMEIEVIKKVQILGILEMKNLGKWTGTTDTSITENWNTMKRPNLRLVGNEEGEEPQLRDSENAFNNIIKEIFFSCKEGDAHKGIRSIQNIR